MQRFSIHNLSGRIIGFVDAINGDIAWLITKLYQPEAAELRPLPS